MKTQIEVTLAGLTIPCSLRYPEAAAYFPKPDPAAPCVGGYPVCLSDEDWRFYLESGKMEDCAHTEFSILTAHFSDALMPHDRMIVHSVAIRYHDRAWLIAAPSGVGKSTQARFLQELRPGEFSVICGDRPALEFRKKPATAGSAVPVEAAAHIGPQTAPAAVPAGSAVPVGAAARIGPHPAPATVPAGSAVPVGAAAHIGPQPSTTVSLSAANRTNSGPVQLPAHVVEELQRRRSPEQWDIIVHPSCWNGKENWYGAEAAPLAGLILLERGEENKLCSLRPREAALPVFTQVIQTCLRAETICKSAELTTRLLNSVPIWRLTSFEVPDSTRLLLESVF